MSKIQIATFGNWLEFNSISAQFSLRTNNRHEGLQVPLSKHALNKASQNYTNRLLKHVLLGSQWTLHAAEALVQLILSSYVPMVKSWDGSRELRHSTEYMCMPE